MNKHKERAIELMNVFTKRISFKKLNKQMEVHHHPHVEQKERIQRIFPCSSFLMIFLAVTLGFFAENIQ